MRISDWSSDVCSSDLAGPQADRAAIARADRGDDGAADALARADRGAARLVARFDQRAVLPAAGHVARCDRARSEEHTSELQSLMRISYAVFCLKKKKKTK